MDLLVSDSQKCQFSPLGALLGLFQGSPTISQRWTGSKTLPRGFKNLYAKFHTLFTSITLPFHIDKSGSDCLKLICIFDYTVLNKAHEPALIHDIKPHFVIKTLVHIQLLNKFAIPDMQPNFLTDFDCINLSLLIGLRGRAREMHSLVTFWCNQGHMP